MADRRYFFGRVSLQNILGRGTLADLRVKEHLHHDSATVYVSVAAKADALDQTLCPRPGQTPFHERVFKYVSSRVESFGRLGDSILELVGEIVTSTVRGPGGGQRRREAMMLESHLQLVSATATQLACHLEEWIIVEWHSRAAKQRG